MSSKMTARERFNAVINFEKTDRVPWVEHPRDLYLYKWHKEGMPIDEIKKITWENSGYIGTELIDNPLFDGLDLESHFGFQELRPLETPINLGPIPQFKVKVLEETEKYVRIRTKVGKILKYPKETREYTSYIMPTFEEYPVEDRSDWKKYKERLDPNDPRRYAIDWNKEDYAELFENFQKGPTAARINGFYGFGQRIMGVPQFLRSFHKNPSLIEDMAEYWKNFTIETIREAVECLEERIDYVFWWEDLAEKNGPTISPGLFEEYMLPHYKELTNFLNKHGIDRIVVDSDGNIKPILDQFIEAGITGFWPLEANAGMDVRKLKEEYGEKLFWIGNIDKRKVVEGGEAMHEEVDTKVSAATKDGGYMPGLDHEIPANCSYKRFKEYADYIKKYL